MENGSPNKRWVGVDFFLNQVPRFRIGTCLGGELEFVDAKLICKHKGLIPDSNVKACQPI